MIGDDDLDEFFGEAAEEDCRELLREAEEMDEDIADLATDELAIGSLLEVDDER